MKIISGFKCFVVTLLLFQTLSRVFQTAMKFSNLGINRGWIYLDKMSFAPGTVTFSVLTIASGIPYGSDGMVTIQAISQNLWQSERANKCQKPPSQPFVDHKVSLNSQIESKPTSKSFNIEETTLYYFVLKDCMSSLKDEYNNDNLDLFIEIHMLNNGKQLGEEEDHWYIVPVILCSGVWLVYFYIKSLKGNDFKQQLHKFVMFIGCATQISSLTWKTFGYLLYAYTGVDYGLFHYIYLFMHSMSESLVIGLIILIGFGWTINFMTSDNWTLYLPIAGIFALANSILTLMTKFTTDLHDRHHIFDNISGTIIIAYRILFLLIFIGGIIYTYVNSRTKVKNFIIQFGAIGSLYITSLPVIIWVGEEWIPAKDRHQFVFVAIQSLKCLTNIAMSLMLNVEKSHYNQISYKNRSFVPQESKYF